jgi:glycosyltransferase involved in cell wall biosynthesis
MRVALLSKSFLPNVGGVETSTAMLARIWQRAGHDVEVVTAVPDPQSSVEAYQVTRDWSWRALCNAIRRSEVAVSNGYSRVAVLAATTLRKRIIVFHQGYQMICTDGLGFRGRQFHHFDPLEDLRLAFGESLGEGVRGLGRKGFDAVVRRWPLEIDHVVPSFHVAKRLGLKRYRVIYQPPNPTVVDALGRMDEHSDLAKTESYRSGDIVFFGRLVFEKGADDLLRAYAEFQRRASTGFPGRAAFPRLIYYGQGPETTLLEQLVKELALTGRVDIRPFVGGEALAAAARKASVVVIPSRWEEPGATIAVELFACGAAVIASKVGAQGEIFAEHGRVYQNGDVSGLAKQLEEHFSGGARYPRPDGDEPWSIEAITRAALALLGPRPTPLRP